MWPVTFAFGVRLASLALSGALGLCCAVKLRMTMLPLRAAVLDCSGVTAACSLCGNDISQTVPSPAGGLKAVVFDRDCGATTGFSTQVSILYATESLPNDGGNTLVLDDCAPVQVKRHSDTSVEISGLGSSSVLRESSLVAAVAVSYSS